MEKKKDDKVQNPLLVPIAKEPLEIRRQLLELQKQIGIAIKGNVAKGEKFSYKYADLNSIMGVARPVLNNNELLLFHDIITGPDNKRYVRTGVENMEGEQRYVDIELIVRNPNDPQAFGSALTYARRYGVGVLLAIQTSEDDDGNAAAGNNNQKNNQQRTTANANSMKPKRIINPEVEPIMRQITTVRELLGWTGEQVTDYAKKLAIRDVWTMNKMQAEKLLSELCGIYDKEKPKEEKSEVKEPVETASDPEAKEISAEELPTLGQDMAAEK